MISKEAHHKTFNEPLVHMKPTLVQKPISPNKPRKIHHNGLEFKMISYVNHDDIEVC